MNVNGSLQFDNTSIFTIVFMVSFDLKKKLFMEESCVSTMATFGKICVLEMTVYLIFSYGNGFIWDHVLRQWQFMYDS